MKRSLLLLSTLFWFTGLYAQFDVSIQANSGPFHYTGSSATATTVFWPSTGYNNAYVITPFGANNAFSYEIGAKVQYVANGFIVGLQSNFQSLRSSEAITQASPYNGMIIFFGIANPSNISATGTAYLRTEYIDVNPYIGYRISTKKLKIDLMPGVDIGYITDSHSYGQVTDVNGHYTFDNKMDFGTVHKDWRLKFEAVVWYKRFGINASQSVGLTNYTGDSPVNTQNAKSRLTLFGISYRIL